MSPPLVHAALCDTVFKNTRYNLKIMLISVDLKKNIFYNFLVHIVRLVYNHSKSINSLSFKNVEPTHNLQAFQL